MSSKEKIKKPQTLFARHILGKVFLEDWGIKVLALLITLALWLGVTGLSTPTTKRFSSVPLNLDISSDAQIVNTPPQEVTIEVSGDKRKLDQINRLTLSASLDLSKMQPGNWVVSLAPDTVYVPLERGIVLVDVAPGRIPVNIEAVQEKELEVRADTSGEVAPDFEVYSTAPQPARIRVRGPASVIGRLENVQTEAINIADRKESFTARQVAITSPNAQTSILNTVVDVNFRIGERRIERKFSVPVVDEPAKFAVCTIYGPRTPLQRAKVEDFKVELYVQENGELAPRLLLPAGLENITEIREVKLNEYQ